MSNYNVIILLILTNIFLNNTNMELLNAPLFFMNNFKIEKTISILKNFFEDKFCLFFNSSSALCWFFGEGEIEIYFKI